MSLFSFADFLPEFYLVDFFTLSQGFSLLKQNLIRTFKKELFSVLNSQIWANFKVSSTVIGGYSELGNYAGPFNSNLIHRSTGSSLHFRNSKIN